MSNLDDNTHVGRINQRFSQEKAYMYSQSTSMFFIFVLLSEFDCMAAIIFLDKVLLTSSFILNKISNLDSPISDVELAMDIHLTVSLVRHELKLLHKKKLINMNTQGLFYKLK